MVKGGFPGEPPEDCDGLCISGRGQETGSAKVLNLNHSNKTLVKHFIFNTLQNIEGIPDWDLYVSWAEMFPDYSDSYVYHLEEHSVQDLL